jgi:anti-sigma B factor antagonist
MSNVHGNAAIIKAPSYVNNQAAEVIAEEANRLIGEGTVHLVLNLAESKMVNSVGIAIIIEVIENASEKGGSLNFCCVSPTIEKTFQIMGLKQLAGVYEDEDTALSNINS